MSFDKEAEFEDAVVDQLKAKGWTGGVISNPSEQDLIDNWASILFRNNNGIDRLNDCELTKTEMAQILDEIERLKTPFKLNEFINGRSVALPEIILMTSCILASKWD